MKTWIVMMTNRSEPEQKVYLLSAHTSREGAEERVGQFDHQFARDIEIIEMHADAPQPPVLIGHSNGYHYNECKKNPANSMF